MNPFFKNVNIFLAQKIHFFYENFRKMEQISECFRKIILKISIFMIPYKSREIPREFLLSSCETYQKSSKNSLDREGLLKRAWKFLKFVEKIDWNL